MKVGDKVKARYGTISGSVVAIDELSTAYVRADGGLIWCNGVSEWIPITDEPKREVQSQWTDPAPCPECHGTGVFVCFTSKSPCSRGCKP